MMGYLDKYKVDVPEGQVGNWKVERFEVSEKDAAFEQIRAVMHGGRGVPAGHYTRLKRGGALVMSDTPDEIRDHLCAIGRAKGNVLINGLGLGVVVQAMLNKPEVEHLTVIEISPEVCQLVGEHYQARFNGKLNIIEADAFDWQPPKGERYNVVWHDVWDHICSDNLPEMHRLHRKYGRRCDWQGSWCRDLCEYHKRRNSGY